MNCFPSLVRLSFVAALLLSTRPGPQTPAHGQESGPISFSLDVRPILSDKCFLCHGPAESTRESDLRLDDQQAAMESGVLTPGDSGMSALLERIVSADPDLQMPPPGTGKSLSDREKQILQQWVQQGAPYESHWAFVAPQRPDVPQVDNDQFTIRNPIDAFVAAQLQTRRLPQSRPADQATLIRRIYLDLVGLPPTPEDVDRWVSQSSDDLPAEMIDALLESEHFGEKWARWWLDAARYADSDGYEKDKPRSVWFYRDWVINAFNRDMPYDQFIVQQVAGDLLPDAGQQEKVATGFLRNSMVNEEGGADPEQFRVEAIFDRVDAIGKAILGITTQCAQCHTHKYDPLSIHEYYQMFAALNDCHDATISAFTPEQQNRIATLERQTEELKQRVRREYPDWQERLETWAKSEAAKLASWKTVVPTDRPFEGQKFRPLEDGSILSESYAPTKTSNTFRLTIEPQTITAFRLDVLTHPQLPRGGPGRSIYGTGALSEFEISIESLEGEESTHKVEFVRAISDAVADRQALTAPYLNQDPDKDDRVTGPIEYAIDGDQKTAWTTDTGPADRNNDRYAVFFPKEPIEVKAKSTLSITLRQLHGGWNSDDNQNNLLGRYRFSVSNEPQQERAALPVAVQNVLHSIDGPLGKQDRDALFVAWLQSESELAEINQRINELQKSFPESDSQLVVQGVDSPRPSHVMLRGDFLNPGDEVQPDAPDFLNAFPQTDEPHRLRFARWLVAEDAPTSARVIVNRIWQAYFGRGLVSTPEDFGFQSSPPSHPRLLDWLAVELMENDWSLKHIHRLILNSATYRQSSAVRAELASVDPNNMWLSRGPRFRVNAESVRDIALAVSGLLNTAIGGPSVYPPAPAFLFQPPASYGPKQWPTSQGGDAYRRSLYVHQYRSTPYPPLQVFDSPKGDAACVRRTRSNTPLQALVMLNEPQFVDCARAMASRVLREAAPNDQDRITRAFRLCVARAPSSAEMAILTELLQQQRERISDSDIDLHALIGIEAELCQQLTGLPASEFAPWMIVCRAMLNLDETITKE